MAGGMAKCSWGWSLALGTQVPRYPVMRDWKISGLGKSPIDRKLASGTGRCWQAGWYSHCSELGVARAQGLVHCGSWMGALHCGKREGWHSVRKSGNGTEGRARGPLCLWGPLRLPGPASASPALPKLGIWFLELALKLSLLKWKWHRLQALETNSASLAAAPGARLVGWALRPSPGCLGETALRMHGPVPAANITKVTNLILLTVQTTFIWIRLLGKY